MKVKLFTGFTKKKNSTKVPGEGATFTELTGTLKEPCNVLNPTIRILRGILDIVPDLYNYAYVAKFGRYYFVDNCTWIDGLWEISMSVDVLASYKTAIGDSTHYVLRTDSTTDFDPMITDVVYPATNDVELFQYSMTSGFITSISSGIYVVGIISGEDSSAVGAISYYAMSASEFGSLKQTLLSDANLYKMGITDINGDMVINDMSKQLLKAMYNPYQYIASCMWFPIGKTAISSSAVTSIKIGWWDYDLSGNLITAQTVDLGEGPGNIHAHPQAATRGAYLNYAPYTRCVCYGRFGTVPIDLSFFDQDDDQLTLTYTVDLITGQCRVRISSYQSSEISPHYHHVAERDFLVGVPIQLAQISVDYLAGAVAAVDTAASTVQNALSLNIGGAISSAAHGIYNTISATMPQMATSGTNGSFINVASTLNTTFTFQHFTIVDEDIGHKGRPLCQLKQISTLSGYILCADGEFDISCLNEERTMINEFLTTGFFWE